MTSEAPTSSETDRDSAVVVDRDGGVWTLTLNRPHRRNALDLEDRKHLISALRRADTDPACRVVVLTGAGSTFSAGGDIASMSQDPEVAAERLSLVAELVRRIVTSSVPIVSAVNGGAFGLGLALAAASDHVVAGDDTKFAASFAKIGLIGDTGIFWSLPRRIGHARAKRMLLFSNDVRAEEALRIGLVDEIVPPGELLQTARERARTLAAAAPLAMAGTKEIFAQEDGGVEAVLASEARLQTQLLASEDFAEGRAAFYDRRPAEFTGR